MAQLLKDGLCQGSEFALQYLNTQVSLSLAEKGGKHQIRKAVPAVWQALQFIWLLASFQPQVVYLSLTNSPSFLGFLRDSLFIMPALMLRKKLAVRFLGGYYFYAHATGWKRAFIGALLGRVHLAMIESHLLGDVFNGLVPAERVVAFPNCVDGEEFQKARARRRVPVSRTPKRVLFMGLMCPEKGVKEVISAIPLVPDAQFIFAGEWQSPEFASEMREFLERHGVAARATFAGVVTGEEKYDLLVSADVFVFPTYFVYEGHAVVSAEATAAGLPVICTDHGALRESVRDGWNGFFVPPKDPEALARRLNQLLSDDELRRTMGERSRQWYEERFTLPAFVENWTRAIQQAAGRGEDG
jgi:glycosyltransferase involved in cell wall biosynthesis